MLQSMENKTTDVLVIGFGNSGGAAAIAAADMGAGVIIVEKMPAGGGTSAVFEEDICVPLSDQFAEYLEVLAYSSKNREQLATLCREAMRIPSCINALGGTIRRTGTGGIYPQVPSCSEMELVQAVVGPENEDPAKTLYDLIRSRVEKSQAEVLYNTEALSLITDACGAVTGAVVLSNGKQFEIRADKGVILACGGFAGNQQLMQDTVLERPVGNLGNPGNTGDGLIMGVRAGAALGSLSVLNDTYLSFRDLAYPVAAPICFGASDVCFVNQAGQRILEEYTGVRTRKTFHADLRHFDFRHMRFDCNPCYAVFDTGVLREHTLSKGGYFAKLYTWSSDNAAELDKGWILKAEDPEKLAEQIGIDPDVFKETLETFYEEKGWPEDPVCAMKLTLGTYHTVGGLIRDEKSRVLGWDNVPVKGLYAAGECSSVLGVVYQPGLYHMEALVSGTMAGMTVIEDAR